MFHAHAEDGDADISSPKIEQTYVRLVNEKEITWMLLTYTRTNGCALDVAHTGGDIEQLAHHMKDDAVHFAIVKVLAGNSTYGVVEKFILITWVGKKVAPQKRSKASRHKRTVATVIKDGVALDVHTSNLDDVKETTLLQKLYTARSSTPAPISPVRVDSSAKPPPPRHVAFDPKPHTEPAKPKPKPGPVPGKQLPTPPSNNTKEKEERERKEKEEKERAEKERLERERKEKEGKERAEKERLEKERLEKERLEKERKEKEEKERLERERLEKEKKEKEEKLKRDAAAQQAKPKPQPVGAKPKPHPSGFNQQGGGLHSSSPNKATLAVPGATTTTTTTTTAPSSDPSTPTKVSDSLSLSDDQVLKEMGRLGRRMGVSPHPARRPTPPATPSAPRHTPHQFKELSFGVGSLQGKRPSMEDRHVALLSLPKNPKIALFGVYDGHQGEEAADFAKESLHEEVDKYLSLVDSKYGGDKFKALTQAFVTLDENFCDEACNNYWDSGTTAIVALYDTETKKILAVNVGDSRCVLSRGAKPIALSEDHKPWVEKEKERIFAAGKTIEDGRVNGSHAFSRSIGDREMKDDLLEAHEQAISPIPEFKEAEVSSDPTEREFLILACDGLWDVMSNAEAVVWVDNKLEEEKDLNKVATALAQHAIDIGSTDNVSILIVGLPK